MSEKVVAILGATGVVGTQMIQCLEERNFPVAKLVPLASAHSAGKTLRFRGEDVTVVEAKPEAFEGVDIVLGAAGDGIAKALLPEAAKRGAVCVDNSHAFRLEPDVPLVIPEINAADSTNHPRNIIANPNCATIIGLVPTWPLHKLAGLRRLIVSTYQAASGAGMPGLTELQREMGVVANGGEMGDTSPFAYQLAANLIPQIGSFKDEGYTSEEWKMQNEGRKIMHLPELKVSCTCVRVPVERSHAVSIDVITEEKLDLADVRAAIEKAPGCRLYDEPSEKIYPMPILTSNQDIVYVGRIRRDLVNENGINLWCCGDQVRKGAATNAVQIAELLIK